MYEFTKNEIRDLLIAFAVLSISFAICNVGTDPFQNSNYGLWE